MPRHRADGTDLHDKERSLILAAEQAAFGAQEKQASSSDSDFSKRLEGIQLPGYQLLKEIHAGGQGVVFRALQQTTRREVAIKFLLSGPLASVDDRERFRRETKVLGQLRAYPKNV